MKTNKRGISLIVLIITIIVMIILAGAIILALESSGVVTNAQKAQFQNDIKLMEEELSVYITNRMGQTNGSYKKETLNASKDSLQEAGETIEGKTIKAVITSIDDKYLDKIVIRNGSIEYIGEDTKELEWANEILLGIENLNLVEKSSEYNELVLENNAKEFLIDYKIDGNTVQEGTPTTEESIEIKSVGEKTKNLFDGVFKQGIINADTGNTSESTTIKCAFTPNYIEIKPNTEYTMTNEIRNLNQKVRFYDIDKNYIGYNFKNGGWLAQNGTSLTRTGTTPDNAYFVRFEVDFSDMETVNAVVNGEYKYMLVEGNVGKEYEPYGYKIPIKVSGKNLINVPSELEIVRSTQKGELYLEPGTYTLSIGEYSSTHEKQMSNFRLDFEDGTYQMYRFGKEIPVKTITTTKKAVAYYFYAYSDYPGSEGITANIKNFMLEKGNTATEYEPYTESTTNIYLKEPLNKVVRSKYVYTDSINFIDRTLTKNTKKIVLTGNEASWTVWNNKSHTFKCGAGETINGGYSTHYQIIDSSKFDVENGAYIYGSDFIIISDLNYSTVEDFKAYLKEQYMNGTPVTFVLGRHNGGSTETVELPNVPLKNGINIIKIKTSVVPSNITASYYSNK